MRPESGPPREARTSSTSENAQDSGGREPVRVLPKVQWALHTESGPADPVSARWIGELGSGGRIREEACRRLFDYLVGCARKEALKRRNAAPFCGPELDDVAHQAAADALIAILTKLHQFRGESRFTTWAYRFVECEVRTKLARHFWRRQPSSIEDIPASCLAEATEAGPLARVETMELLAQISSGIRGLTDRQRTVLVSITMNESSVEDVARATGSNRNALYKALFDARRHLRADLEKSGLEISA